MVSGPSESTSMKSAMRSMLHQGFSSDLVIVFGGKKFNLHRAMLAVRSPKLAKLIAGSQNELHLSNVRSCNSDEDRAKDYIASKYSNSSSNGSTQESSTSGEIPPPQSQAVALRA